MDLKERALNGITSPEVIELISRLINIMPPEVSAATSCKTGNPETFIIQMGDPCEIVIILLDGILRIENELQNGILYTIDRVEPPNFIGAAESFADISDYRGSIICETKCRYISIPSPLFMDWMRKSNEALFIFTSKYIKTIIRQVSKDRTFLFFPGEIRLAYQLIRYFEENEINGSCALKIPRHQLADETRISVKTVNRCIAKLKKKGLISQTGHYISINTQQHDLLLDMIEQAEL